MLNIDDDHFQKRERFTVIPYDKTSHLSFFDETRRELFCHKKSCNEQLPPTMDALLLHTRRSGYQAGIWTISGQAQFVNLSSLDCARTKVSQSWVPVWMTIPEVSSLCRELIKCSCKGDCSNCSCGKANLAHQFASATVLQKTLQTVSNDSITVIKN